MAPPHRAHQSSSPFSSEEETWIILDYGTLKNTLLVRRAFSIQFKKNPKNIPDIMAFNRLIKRFKDEGDVKPKVPEGRPALSEEKVEEVKAPSRITSSSKCTSPSPSLDIIKCSCLLTKKIINPSPINHF